MNKRKRIGIDARLIAQTGVGRYIQELVQGIPFIAKDHSTELYIYIREQDAHLIPKDLPNVHIRLSPHMWHSWSEQWGFYLQLMKDNLDLVHFTYFSFPLLYRRPYVITLHDLTPLTHATGSASTKHPFVYLIKKRAYEILIRVAARQSKAVITPTHTVAHDVSRLLFISTDKIHVTYEGISSHLLNTHPSKASLHAKSYFLYVGNMYPHKNVELVLHALTHLPETYDLVLVGAHDHFTHHIQQLVRKLSLENRVIFTGKVSDADLATYYTHAIALVHPSLAEGFGLTPLEALYFGSPVIASDLPIFREVLDTSFTPINPHDENSLVQAMKKHIKHAIQPKMSPDHVKKTFSFQTMTTKTWKLYLHILSQ